MASPDTTLTPEAEQAKQFRMNLLRATTNNIDPVVLGTVTVGELIALEERLYSARTGNGDQSHLEDIVDQSVEAQPRLRRVLDHVVTGLNMTIGLLVKDIASGNTDYLLGHLRSSDAPIPPREHKPY